MAVSYWGMKERTAMNVKFLLFWTAGYFHYRIRRNLNLLYFQCATEFIRTFNSRLRWSAFT